MKEKILKFYYLNMIYLMFSIIISTQVYLTYSKYFPWLFPKYSVDFFDDVVF